MAEGYDYIVVGGGSSGCLVTARLAEAGARVLLLEAGPDDKNPLIRMPAGYVKLLGVEKYMWFYKSVPQAHLGGRTPIIKHITHHIIAGRNQAQRTGGRDTQMVHRFRTQKLSY